MKLRDQGVLIAAPLQTAIAFAGHFAAIRSLCDELNNIRSAMEGLPRFGQPLPEAKPHWDFLPTIDWFWVKVGIKGGLAAVISVLLLKWINPPGSGFNSAHGVDSHHFWTAISASRWHR